MSRSTVISTRYAKALFQLALEQGLVSETEEQLRLIVSAVENNTDIRTFLKAPNITLETKIQTLKGVLQDKAAVNVLNTIGLLLERGRINELPSMLEAYLQVAGEALNRADAYVTSAQLLTEEEKVKVAANFGTLLGKTIRVTNTVNSELLGGLTVRIGDTLYDGSLKGKLERLDKALHTAAI